MNRTVGQAIDRADDGNVASGYDLLLSGLSRARLRRLIHAPCADEMIRLWEHACEIYCARYLVLIEEPSAATARADND